MLYEHLMKMKPIISCDYLYLTVKGLILAHQNCKMQM